MPFVPNFLAVARTRCLLLPAHPNEGQAESAAADVHQPTADAARAATEANAAGRAAFDAGKH